MPWSKILGYFSKVVFNDLFSDELVKVHKMKPTLAWKEKFDNYLSTMPNYYAGVGGCSSMITIFSFCFNYYYHTVISNTLNNSVVFIYFIFTNSWKYYCVSGIVSIKFCCLFDDLCVVFFVAFWLIALFQII